jgi:amidophosphoribosyltransferase
MGCFREDDFYPREECGVFGIFGHPEAATLTYLGIYAQQHRGQESAGIVSSDSRTLHLYKQQGLVADIFTEDVLAKLPGRAAIGHVRYSTMGTSTIANAQPVKVDYLHGSLAISHNGNIVNAYALREKLEQKGSIFASTSDSEVIIHLLAKPTYETLIEAASGALSQLKGAYSLIFLEEERMIAARDPHGWRPLCMGELDGAIVFASETCAFDIIGAEYIRDVEPGELVEVTANGVRSYKPFEEAPHRMCIFEYVYFSRPDSKIFGRPVQRARKALGIELAREEPKPLAADLVIPVPDSSNTAALGYAEGSGIPFDFGIIRSHYIGRTFIEPTQRIRTFGTRLKYNPVRELLDGKSIVVVDDSIVRGTTSRKIIDLLRRAGAGEIHLRVSCPPWKYPCYYGIDTPTRGELIGSSNTVDEIARYAGVDSLRYLGLEGLRRAVGGGEMTAKEVAENFCDACFTGDYPTEIDEDYAKEMMVQRAFSDTMF